MGKSRKFVVKRLKKFHGLILDRSDPRQRLQQSEKNDKLYQCCNQIEIIKEESVQKKGLVSIPFFKGWSATVNRAMERNDRRGHCLCQGVKENAIWTIQKHGFRRKLRDITAFISDICYPTTSDLRGTE